jgi:hypothetical protein
LDTFVLQKIDFCASRKNQDRKLVQKNEAQKSGKKRYYTVSKNLSVAQPFAFNLIDGQLHNSRRFRTNKNKPSCNTNTKTEMMKVISIFFCLLSFDILLAFESHGRVTRATLKYSLLRSLIDDNTVKSTLNGLLQGIETNELESSSYYTDNYNGNITMETGLWDAAQANPKFKSADEHIARCKKNIAVYLKSKFFCDREDTMKLMEEYANNDGYFAILCGGPSIGKTLMLKNIATKSATNKRVYIMVDGRKAGPTPNLFNDIIAAFDTNNVISQDVKGKVFQSILELIVPLIGQAASNLLPDLDVSGAPQAIKTLFKSKDISDVNKLECFVKAIKKNGKSLTIIIDEANEYFNVDTSAPKQVPC